jgi:hypothetical protein
MKLGMTTQVQTLPTTRVAAIDVPLLRANIVLYNRLSSQTQ